MPSQNDASGKKEDYAVEEMTFALEEQLFQAPGIPDGVTLEEVNYFVPTNL
jgi:HIV Tat-specific factor 1